MFRIDDATAATTLPTPETAGTEGFFTEGNAGAGTPATNVRGSWLNMIQEELASILAAAGIARAKGTNSQVNASLQKMYGSVVGTVRNLAMSVTAASASATITADEVVVEVTAGGQTYKLAAVNKAINLATTGAGGMDTGTAPASGWVGIYAIYNPTTGASALLAVNATSAVVSEVYSGANMPSGYTASALVSVVPTTGAGLIQVLTQADRTVAYTGASIFTTASTAASPSIVNNLGVPLNAKFCSGFIQAGSSIAGSIGMALYATSATVGGKIMAVTITAGSSLAVPFERLRITLGQRTYYTGSSAGGTSSFGATVNQYEF